MSEIEKKNTIYIAVIFVVLLITLGFSFTFAFIGGVQGDGNIIINGGIKDVSKALSLTYSGDTNLSLNISMDNLSALEGFNDYSSYIESDVALINVILTSDSTYYPNGVNCRYSAKYVASNTYVPSNASVYEGLKEFTAMYALDDMQFHEVLISGENSAFLFEDFLISNEDVAGFKYTQPVYFKLRFYNLGVNQNDAIGQTPSGKIEIIPGECDRL